MTIVTPSIRSVGRAEDIGTKGNWTCPSNVDTFPFGLHCLSPYSWVPTSVTRYYIVKSPNFYQKLPKNIHRSFYFRSDVFKNRLKCHQIFWALFKEYLSPKTFQKPSNLVTLVPTFILVGPILHNFLQ